MFLNQPIEAGKPFYSVRAPLTQSNIGGHTGYFQSWTASGASIQDGGPANGYNSAAVVFTSSNPTVTANYKGLHLTSVSTALANTSQRKVVRADAANGYLFLVYESSNRIWLERSTDDGTTWTLVNGAQPVDGGPESKLPSIDCLPGLEYGYPNEVFMTYQQKTANGNFTIQLARFNTSGVKLSDQTIYTSPSSYTNNATPVVGVTWYYRGEWRKQLVGIWKEPASAGVSAGLYWYPAYYAGSTFNWNDPVGKYYLVQSTNSASVSPSLDVFKYDYEQRISGTLWFHFAWEQDQQSIKYQRVVCGYSGLSVYGSPTTLTWFFSYHYRPSITTVSNTGARLCWKGSLDQPEPHGDDLAQTLFVDPASPGNFWYFGSFVQNASINSYFDDMNGTSAFALAWSQNSGSGYSSYAVKSTALGSPINLNTSGRDLQLYNGWDFSTMGGISLLTTAPYAFDLSDAIESGGLMAGGSPETLSGRTAVAAFQDTSGAGPQFFFTLKDVLAGGTRIGFSEAGTPDKTGLVSNPFTLTGSTQLSCGIQYGVKDSVAAALLLGKEDFIRFTVELVDVEKGEVIEELTKVQYGGASIIRRNEVSLNAAGTAGERTVRLRLTAVSSLPALFSAGTLVVPARPGMDVRLNKAAQPVFDQPAVVNQYHLGANYPNPFNPATNIQYAIPEAQFVTLRVYDLLGRQIAVLVSDPKEPGMYTVPFDAAGLPSGIYFYHLTAGKYSMIKKMMFMK